MKKILVSLILMSISAQAEVLVSVLDVKSQNKNYSNSLCHEIEKQINQKERIDCISQEFYDVNHSDSKNKFKSQPNYTKYIQITRLNTSKDEILISSEGSNSSIYRSEMKLSGTIDQIAKESSEYILSNNTEELKNKKMAKSLYQGQQIVIDTYDTEACEQVKSYLTFKNIKRSQSSMDLSGLCNTNRNDPQDRYRTVTTLWETNEEYVTKINTKFLTSTDKSIVSETRNLSYLMAAAVGVIWMLPESISKWDKKDVTSTGFFNKYKENIKAGPVVDKDDWAINYIGHPVSGAAYYSIARNLGYTKMQSFGYSVLMSTFFWEYGFEAFAEKPSIQDLIITPVIGSIMGEAFYQWSEKIKNNENGLWGSKRLGQIALFILNPAGEISNKINHLLGSKIIQNSKLEFVTRRTRPQFSGQNSSQYIGVQLKFEW